MSMDTLPKTIKSFPQLGGAALVGGAACILLAKPLLYMGRKVNAFIDHTMPSLKGSLNSAAVIAPTNLVAIPLTKYALSHKSDSLHPEDHRTLSTLIGAATLFFSTTVLTPKLSRVISSYQVSSLGAALYGLAGAGGFFSHAAETEGFFSEQEERLARYKREVKLAESGEITINIASRKQIISDIEENTSYLQIAKHNINSSFWSTTYALAGGVVGLLAFNLISTTHSIFQTHAAPFFKNIFEASKGPANAALVTGMASFIAIPLSKYTFSKVGSSLYKKDHEILSCISGMAVIILATTLLTPRLSRLISTHQVTSLRATLYGLAGAGVFAYQASKNNGFHSDAEKEIIDLQHTLPKVKDASEHKWLSSRLSDAKAAHARTSYVQSLFNTASHSCMTGAYTFGAGAAGLLIYQLALTTSRIFQTHATPFMKSSVQALKGPGNAAIVITGASLAAIPLRDYVARKLGETELRKQDQAMFSAASGALAVFLATTFLTPKLSSYISSHRVSYLGASLYGLAGSLAFAHTETIVNAVGALLED